MKCLFLFSLFIIFTNCKSNKGSINNKFGNTFEDTLFENSKSEEHTVNTMRYSKEQNETVLVIFNKKQIPFSEFKKRAKVFSESYKLKILKNKDSIKKYNTELKYETLIIIN